MPASIRENDSDVIAFVKAEGVFTVLDVGVGWGTYSTMLRDYVSFIDGIEAWQPYFDQFDLRSRYDMLIQDDVRTLATQHWRGKAVPYDLIIFGDVLEHMERDEALEVWAWAHDIARWGLISLPMGHYPQGPEYGNPFEVHVEGGLTGGELLEHGNDFGPFEHFWTYAVTGTFIKRFK